MMSKKKMSKTQSQRWHFKWALYDRYGIYCNRHLYYAIRDMIASCESEFLLKQSNSRMLHKLIIPKSLLNHEKTHPKTFWGKDSVKVYVVYDKRRRELITALPWYSTDEEMLKDYEENHRYER